MTRFLALQALVTKQSKLLATGFVEGVGEQSQDELELKTTEGDRVDMVAEVGDDAAKEALDGVAQDLFARFDLGALAAHAVTPQAGRDFQFIELARRAFEFFAHVSGFAKQLTARGSAGSKLL